MFYLNKINNIKLLNTRKLLIDFEFRPSIWPISVFACNQEIFNSTKRIREKSESKSNYWDLLRILCIWRHSSALSMSVKLQSFAMENRLSTRHDWKLLVGWRITEVLEYETLIQLWIAIYIWRGACSGSKKCWHPIWKRSWDIRNELVQTPTI